MTKKIPSGTAFLNAEAILKKVGVSAGNTVVDLGCGGGYFVLEAARLVGDEGVVFGVDVLKGALSAVGSKAILYGLANVKTVWADAEVYGGARRVRDSSADVVLLIQLLCQSKKHHNIFKETSRMVKQGGAVVVIDWKSQTLEFAPRKEECVAAATVKQVAQSAGLTFQEEFIASPYHYGLIFKKR